MSFSSNNFRTLISQVRMLVLGCFTYSLTTYFANAPVKYLLSQSLIRCEGHTQVF